MEMMAFLKSMLVGHIVRHRDAGLCTIEGVDTEDTLDSLVLTLKSIMERGASFEATPSELLEGVPEHEWEE